MIKKLLQILVFVIIVLVQEGKTQSQLYWTEGFSSDVAIPCNLTTIGPTSKDSSYFDGNAGRWYRKNVYRIATASTGSCPNTTTINERIRAKNISGVTDSGYLITPIVNFGIKDMRFYRGRASRSYTIWVTNDTLATTNNWNWAALVLSSLTSSLCTDTIISVNSATARRLKIVTRPGTDSDYDSVRLWSVTPIITPLNWMSFSSILNEKKQVTLNWQVQENNVGFYEVEESKDGVNYKSLSTIKSKGDGVNTYTFLNSIILKTSAYYRIRQIDFDGKYSYSTILKISNEAINLMQAYPNPANDKLNLSNLTIGTQVILTDLSGKILQTINVANNSFTIDISKYSKGVYLLKANNGATQKIIKQ